jgi:hypothetical protein
MILISRDVHAIVVVLWSLLRFGKLLISGESNAAPDATRLLLLWLHRCSRAYIIRTSRTSWSLLGVRGFHFLSQISGEAFLLTFNTVSHIVSFSHGSHDPLPAFRSMS